MARMSGGKKSMLNLFILIVGIIVLVPMLLKFLRVDVAGFLDVPAAAMGAALPAHASPFYSDTRMCNFNTECEGARCVSGQCISNRPSGGAPEQGGLY